MHVWIHHGLSPSRATIHAYVESITGAGIYHVLTQSVGLVQTFCDTSFGILCGHEKSMAHGDRIPISINFHSAEIAHKISPRHKALATSIFQRQGHLESPGDVGAHLMITHCIGHGRQCDTSLFVPFALPVQARVGHCTIVPDAG